MGNLYEILANAQGGKAMAMLGREFELTQTQVQSAVTALLQEGRAAGNDILSVT
jgi:hypothetical protein